MKKKTKSTDLVVRRADAVQTQEWRRFEQLVTGMGVHRADGFVNTITGLGGQYSKGKAAQFEPGFLLSPEMCELLYTEVIPARIVDLIVDDATREGFDLTIEEDQDQDVAADIVDRFEELDLESKVNEGAKWGRLYGWGGLLLVTDEYGSFEAGGPLATPLPETARLTNVVVLERLDVLINSWDLEPTSPTYGSPKTYQVMSRVPGARNKTTIVDASRIIVFSGMRAPRQVRWANQGFDLSVLQQPHDIIAQHGLSWEAIAALLQDAAQAVYGVSNLMQAVTAGQGEALKARFQTLDQMRAINRAIVIDKDKESFERKDYAFSGYDKLIDKIETRLAMAAGMPVTVLMGVSPAGLNATGESDMTLWENKVKSYQKKQITPAWEKLVGMLARETSIGEETWKVCPRPLRQMSRAEEAQIRKTVADTDAVYIGQGVLTPEEVAISRFGPRGWNPETQIDLETRAQIVEIDAKTALEQAQNPPEPTAPGEAPADGAPPKGEDDADPADEA